MAWKVSAVGQKGGTGKDTTLEALAVAYAAVEWDVMACDFDTQQASLVDWAKLRATNGITPAVPAKQYLDVASAVRENDHRDLILLNGLPHGSTLALDVAKASDLVLITTGPAHKDMKPSVLLAHRLVKEGVPKDRIAFVLHRTSSKGLESAESLEYLRATGYHVIDGFLRTMKSYSDAQDIGQAVTEVRAPGLRAEANQLIAGIIERIEQLMDATEQGEQHA